MAGSPVKRRLARQLEERTRVEFPDDLAATRLDYVARWQANGNTLRRLASNLDVSPAMLTEYLRSTFGAAETKAALTLAREAGAHNLAERVLEIADGATEDTVQVSRLQVSATQWVAEKWNAAELGPRSAGANVTVNIGTLMLSALMQPIPPKPAIATVIVSNEETLSIDPATSYDDDSSIEVRTVDDASEGSERDSADLASAAGDPQGSLEF